jgi:hypothetical protein
MFGKIYPNYRKLAKTKKKLSQTLKHVSKCDKVFFPTKKKDEFLKKIAIFFFEKREFVKRNPLLFFRKF